MFRCCVCVFSKVFLRKVSLVGLTPPKERTLFLHSRTAALWAVPPKLHSSSPKKDLVCFLRTHPSSQIHRLWRNRPLHVFKRVPLRGLLGGSPSVWPRPCTSRHSHARGHLLFEKTLYFSSAQVAVLDRPLVRKAKIESDAL